jgi:signal transduction histidine kinase
LDNIADGVIALDETMNIFVFNDAASNSLEINHSLVEGKNYFEIFQNDIFNVRKVIDSKTPFSEEKIKYITNNSNYKYLAYTTNILNEEGKINAIIILLRDISEQVRAQQQIELKEKQVAIGQLASGIAHEIRNPLNAINIIIQRFQMEFEVKDDNDEFQKMLITLRSEISRINQIIEQFLNFARPPKLQIERTNLSELIEETIYLMQVQAQQSNITLEKNVEPNLFAEIDRSKIKQVLINLIKNAIEAITNGGKITIESKLQRNNAIIKITDTGNGMSDEIKNKIFTLYFTTKKAGTGLGLSIVHQIITEHNGEIECDSKEGFGTTFELKLPINNK